MSSSIYNPSSGSALLYSNIPTSTTTVVKTGSGLLHAININTIGTTSTVTVYDNTAGSGTKIATLSSVAQNCLIYDCKFTTGLTIVTAGGAPADITVTYK